MTVAVPLPPTRQLKIFAIDPQFTKRDGNRVTVSVDYEHLSPGPVGDRIAVIDYDSANNLYYEPVDLENPAILMQGGLDHSEADPRFHQQMVYAVAMRTLQHFDRALGRRIQLWHDVSRPKLRLMPHAFNGPNAYYDSDLHAILFGYFRADPDDAGQNLPNQIVFTCLSHDIIAHEMTHALIHRMRPHFLEPTNPDILAFHEGFADLVALFQHFTYAETLRAEIARVRGDLKAPSILSEIAIQFGQATRSGAALRSALQDPGAKLSARVREPHRRGGILVAAVFDAFNASFANEAAILIRLATGGSGMLAPGALHPDLIDQLAKLAARLADAVLTMIIRAFDYMPPMDMTFGDFLRALVTSDLNIAPEDRYELRAAMIEAFRARAIYPEGVLSLAEESLAYPLADFGTAFRLRITTQILQWFDYETVHASLETADARSRNAEAAKTRSEKDHIDYGALQREAAKTFHAFARKNAKRLGLSPDPNVPIAVAGFHRVARVSPNGRVLNEIVLRFEQHDKTQDGSAKLGGLKWRGGCTVIASADGLIRYIIGKPIAGSHDAAKNGEGRARLAAIEDFVAECDASDPRSAYTDPSSRKLRMVDRASLRGLHEGLGA